MLVVSILVLAYILGAIPFGVIFAKLKGVNLLESGSRSSGATNAYRTAGLVVGLATALFDILKGLVAVWIADLVLEPVWQIYLAGLLAIVGHTMSVFMRFKGGKAIATSFGVFLYVNPIAILVTAGVWVLTMVLTRIVSLSSIVAAVAFPVLTLFFWKGWIVFGLTMLVAVYAIYRHKANIVRLIQGNEKRIVGTKRDLK